MGGLGLANTQLHLLKHIHAQLLTVKPLGTISLLVHRATIKVNILALTLAAPSPNPPVSCGLSFCPANWNCCTDALVGDQLAK